MKPKIFGLCNGGSPGWYDALAMAEDGTVVAQHACSHPGWVRHDLGMDGESTWKHELYAAHYPDGYELVFVPDAEVLTHPGLTAAYAANQEQRRVADAAALAARGEVTP